MRMGVPDLGPGHVSVVRGAVPDSGIDGAAAAAQGVDMSMLGGYDPPAARNTHQANTPTLIPLPSLLRSLLSDHLDPRYAAAAEATAAGTRRQWCEAWA